MARKGETIFLEYFGDSPLNRVLDFFIENDLWDYNKSDIFRNTGVSRTALDSILDNLSKKEILKKTRTVGKSVMYKLNRGNKVVEALVKFAYDVVMSVAEQEISASSLIAKAEAR